MDATKMMMKPSQVAIAAIVLLAGAVGAAMAGSGHMDQTLVAKAWIAEARRQAQPVAQAASSMPVAVAGAAAVAELPLADPFGLQQRQELRLQAGRQERAAIDDDRPEPSTIADPVASVRILGTLLRENAAYAVLQIDGAIHRLRVGEQLPSDLGRVVRIGEDRVEISSDGKIRMLTLDSTQAEILPSPPPASRGRNPKRRLVRPGADA